MKDIQWTQKKILGHKFRRCAIYSFLRLLLDFPLFYLLSHRYHTDFSTLFLFILCMCVCMWRTVRYSVQLNRSVIICHFQDTMTINTSEWLRNINLGPNKRISSNGKYSKPNAYILTLTHNQITTIESAYFSCLFFFQWCAPSPFGASRFQCKIGISFWHNKNENGIFQLFFCVVLLSFFYSVILHSFILYYVFFAALLMHS